MTKTLDVEDRDAVSDLDRSVDEAAKAGCEHLSPLLELPPPSVQQAEADAAAKVVAPTEEASPANLEDLPALLAPLPGYTAVQASMCEVLNTFLLCSVVSHVAVRVATKCFNECLGMFILVLTGGLSYPAVAIAARACKAMGGTGVEILPGGRLHRSLLHGHGRHWHRDPDGRRVYCYAVRCGDRVGSGFLHHHQAVAITVRACKAMGGTGFEIQTGAAYRVEHEPCARAGRLVGVLWLRSCFSSLSPDAVLVQGCTASPCFWARRSMLRPR